MSAPTVPPLPDTSALNAFRSNLAAGGERRLILVETEQAQAGVSQAVALLQACSSDRCLWVGASEPDQGVAVERVSQRQVRDRLGSELDVVVWNGWSGTDPDGLVAISGCLVAGGLLIWLMPPLSRWSRFEDPDYRRSGLEDVDHHPFAGRLARILVQDHRVLRLSRQPAFESRPRVAGSPPFRIGTTDDQRELIDQIVRTGQGRRRRPLVIRADRGRGKSHALGVAAARLLNGKWQRVVVTAPRFSAVATLFSAACSERPGAVSEGQRLVWETGEELVFLPIDQLLAQQPEAGLVMIDEAAGLPAGLLSQALTGWPRVVFSTTVHGYEGTGRGFDVRFRQVLDRLTPQWQLSTLREPIRWSLDDPLEPLIRQLFLLDAEGPERISESEVVIQSWRPADSDDDTLQKAFGLLTDAHYRTTPADLRHWLDEPDGWSWLALQDGEPVGVLWTRLEGRLDEALAQAVTEGRRRMRGHLLPQSLANHGGRPEAAMMAMLRVVRIAVHPDLRRQGLGQRLVSAAREEAQRQNLDVLGSSFGGTAELARFWAGAGMTPVRIGLHRDSSSGEHTLQVAQGLSESGKQLVGSLARRFGEHWPWLLQNELRDLEPALVLLLTAHWAGDQSLTEDDRSELAQFASGYRLFELSRLPLVRLGQQPGVVDQIRQSGDAELWCRRCLQNRSWTFLQHRGLCMGRQDGERRLRRLTGELLEHHER